MLPFVGLLFAAFSRFLSIINSHKGSNNVIITSYVNDGKIAARGANVARHSFSSGPQKHLENTFKSEFSSNLSQQMLVLTA